MDGIATTQGIVNPPEVKGGPFSVFRIKGAAEPGLDLLIQAAEVLGGGRLQSGVQPGGYVFQRQIRNG
jgi:hypothetical protein